MWRTAEVSLRPEIEADREFIEDLVFAVRENEPGFRDLPLGERSRLLKDQARLQSAHYRRLYPAAHFLLIEAGGNPVGRYYVSQEPDHLLILELSILPAFQRHGIGSRLMASAQAEAVRTGVPVKLSVELGNPALAFYEKLGFVKQRREGAHFGMTWWGHDRK